MAIMVVLLKLLNLLAFFWITLLFVVIAIIRAKHKDSWVWYIIGAVASLPVFFGTFQAVAYALGFSATWYRITYVVILVVAAAIIRIRQRRRDQENSEPIFNRQDMSVSQWGYDKQTPIATSNVQEYLSCLRTQEGEKINWVHDGATTVYQVYGIKEVIVEAYKGYSEMKPGSALFRLYVTQAHKQMTTAPKGLVLDCKE